MRFLQSQMSESFRVAFFLALTGGFLDAHTYLFRGNVFANAQTGNIVLFGISLAEGNGRQALFYAIPIVAFIVGILATETVRRFFALHTRPQAHLHWRQVMVAAEILVLAAVAFIPKGDLDPLANVAISFICSLQTETFRKIHGQPFATTMCTGNLRSATERLFRFLLHRESTADLEPSCLCYATVLVFIAGAFIGAICTTVFDEKSVLGACALLAFAFTMMFRTPTQPSEAPGKTPPLTS